MRKSIIYILLFLVISFLCVISNVFAYQQSSYPYTIDNYNIDVKVNEDNTLNITENIIANFLDYRYGITRKIPLANKIVRKDGTIYNSHAKISDIYVNDTYSISNQADNKSIKIGDPNNQIRGVKEYTISYIYNLGEDKAQNCDELCFNLIGDEWNTIIRNISFKIIMPKEFDKSLLSFSSGIRGSVGRNDVHYDVNGNTITGSYNTSLKPCYGLTVRLQLPDKYFVAQKQTIDISSLLVIILPIVFALIAWWRWYKYYKYRKNKNGIKAAKFYPPEDFNSAEIGFIYKGKAESEDIVSLLIHLANKGYIKISEYEEETSIGIVKSFKIIKLKNYDDYNKVEKVFFNGLFDLKSNKSVDESVKNTDNSITYEVTKLDLSNKFYITLNKIKNILDSKKNYKDPILKISLAKYIFVKILLFVTFLINLLRAPFIQLSTVAFVINITLLTGAGLFILLSMFKHKNLFAKILGFIFCYTFGGIQIFSKFFPDSFKDPTFYIIFFGILIGSVFLPIIYNIIKRVIGDGNKNLEKIQEFKNNLETIQKDKIEELINNDPTYFYDMLPFTYALKISDKWIKKFEDISLVAPKWYDGYSTFTFDNFITTTMASITSAMMSSPSKSSYESHDDGLV